MIIIARVLRVFVLRWNQERKTDSKIISPIDIFQENQNGGPRKKDHWLSSE